MSDEQEYAPFSLGFRFGTVMNDLLAKAQGRHFMEQSLYWGDPDYRNLKDAMTRLRRLRYDEDDYAALDAVEARAFRLLATLRRLNDELEAANV